MQGFFRLLDIDSSWQISKIQQDKESHTAEIHVTHKEGLELHCPECGKVCPEYDRRSRRWRHTDLCDYRTWVVADVPRVECSEHGIQTISVPWATDTVPYTTSFEADVISWLEHVPVSAVARNMGISSEMASSIIERAEKTRRLRTLV